MPDPAPASPHEEPRPASPPLIDEASGAPLFNPNPALKWAYTRFFERLGVDPEWATRVRAATDRGTVVYVMDSASAVDFLCLDHLVQRFGLPPLRFVNTLGSSSWILEPFGEAERRLRREPLQPPPEALAEVLDAGQGALLFLRKNGRGIELDLIRTVVELQRRSDRPALLLPQSFLWTRRAEAQDPRISDFLFGTSANPNLFRSAFRLLVNARHAAFRSGEPFDVAAFLEEHPDLDDAAAADAIRYAVVRRIERERRLVQGPAKKSPARLREELLRSPRLRKHLEHEASQKGKTLEEVVADADDDLQKLIATPDQYTIQVFGRLLEVVWERIYSGFVVDKEGIERLRDAARKGPLVLLPSHKSHADYLILSYVLERNEIQTPLIAAGDNLDFFPIGDVLRRSGAFFIRRSFKGSRLYPQLVDAYLRKVLAEGFHVEFFLEGGRSRTGKLLAPKLGLLSMVVDAGLKLPGVNLSFVPISIGYERIIEEGAYSDEQRGGQKEPESIEGLLRSSTILQSRYGRLYVQFGEIFTLDELLEDSARLRGDTGRDLRKLKPPQRRALIQRIAHRVTYEINRATIVTPSGLVATALMSHRRRGMRHEQLFERCEALYASLVRRGARLAPSLGGGVRHEVIDEALALFRNARLVETRDRVHSVPEGKRLSLEYHKNTSLHWFVPSALISAALARPDVEPPTPDRLRERVADLSRLFKYEFQFRADASFDEIFDDALASLEAAGEVARAADRVFPNPGSLMGVYRTMIGTYIEAYRLVALTLDELGQRTELKRKDWLAATLARGQRLYLAGDLDYPESVSKAKVDNALASYHDAKVIRLTKDGIAQGKRYDDRIALTQRLGKYLPR
jgi:glycerol-3-phosphate O-acyltransferase